MYALQVLWPKLTRFVHSSNYHVSVSLSLSVALLHQSTIGLHCQLDESKSLGGEEKKDASVDLNTDDYEHMHWWDVNPFPLVAKGSSDCIA